MHEPDRPNPALQQGRDPLGQILDPGMDSGRTEEPDPGRRSRPSRENSEGSSDERKPQPQGPARHRVLHVLQADPDAAGNAHKVNDCS